MTGVGRRNNSMNYMQVILQNLMSLTFSDVIDIAVVSFLIYQIVKLAVSYTHLTLPTKLEV